MTTDLTKKVAGEVFDRRLGDVDVESGLIFKYSSFQMLVDSMAPDIDMTLRGMDEDEIIAAGKDQEPSAEEYIDCLHAMCYAVLDDVVELAVTWWNGRIEKMTEEATSAVPGKTRVYRVYVADGKGNEDTLYIGTDFDEAKAAAIALDMRMTENDRGSGLRAALAFGDMTADVETLTEGEKDAAWANLSDKTPVMRTVWDGLVEI